MKLVALALIAALAAGCVRPEVGRYSVAGGDLNFALVLDTATGAFGWVRIPPAPEPADPEFERSPDEVY